MRKSKQISFGVTHTRNCFTTWKVICVMYLCWNEFQWVFGLSGPLPPKNIQPAQPPPTQSPVTMIMCTLLSIVYGLFKPCWFITATCTCFKEITLLFNLHISCLVNFIMCPTDKYMFKVKNEKIRLICWICSKLKLNTTWHHYLVFIVDFDQSQCFYF